MIDAQQEYLNSTQKEKKTCFFCKWKNGKHTKFIHHHSFVVYVCPKCIDGLGGKAQTQDVLERIYLPPEQLNFNKGKTEGEEKND